MINLQEMEQHSCPQSTKQCKLRQSWIIILKTTKKTQPIARSSLVHVLDRGEVYIADGGYHDGSGYGVTPTARHEYSDRQKVVVRVRHETVNGRLKNWGCLRNLWRHRVEKHRYAFRAVANLVQLEMETGSQAFQLEYNENEN